MISKHEVLGIFQDPSTLSRCVAKLRDEGFLANQIKTSLPNPLTDVNQNFLMLDKQTKAPESAITGAIVVGLIGLFLGGLVGGGFLTQHGTSGFLFSKIGPLGLSLVGLFVGAAVGAIGGGLIGRGVPEDDAKGYERSLKPGEILLSVHASNVESESLAMSVLTESGCKKIITKRTDEQGIGKRPLVRRANDPHPIT